MLTDKLKALALAASCLLIIACPNTNADSNAGNDASTENIRDGSSTMDLPTESPPACIDTILCIRGDHFDTTLCKCVPDQDAAPPVDTKPACIDTILCIRGDHFDTTLCKCVPDQDAAPPVDTKPACIDTILCIRGDHFDTTLCKCVPTASGSPCTSATDCTGALPALCQQCADGSNGCAHFACVAGLCQLAYCP